MCARASLEIAGRLGQHVHHLAKRLCVYVAPAMAMMVMILVAAAWGVLQVVAAALYWSHVRRKLPMAVQRGSAQKLMH